MGVGGAGVGGMGVGGAGVGGMGVGGAVAGGTGVDGGWAALHAVRSSATKVKLTAYDTSLLGFIRFTSIDL